MSTPTLPFHIVICESGDLTLRLFKVEDENDSFLGADLKTVTTGHILTTMKVSRDALINNSKVFKVALTRWAEAKQSTVDIEVDTVAGIEVVLRAIHKTLIDSSYAVSIEEIWEVMQYCKNREVETEKLEPWFATSWEKTWKKDLKIEDIRKLLTPAYIFDHAQAFAFLTRSLVYKMADHITEHNPTEYRSLHLPGNAIGSMNGARGSLRTKMLRELFDPVSAFLMMRCDCKEKSLFAYNMGLSKTGIWPLHDHYKKSIQQVLNSPGFLKFECTVPENACLECRGKLSVTAINRVRCDLIKYFDGLCLDCMKKTKSGDVDDDYWEHDFEKTWDSGCRIKHGQPSWYFSFMGRKTDMKNHNQKKKERREGRRH